MTCIIGVVDKKNKKVFIGGDSLASNGSEKTKRKDKKVFKVGEFLIGCTSSFRMIQLLQFSFKPPEIKKDIYEYMCTDFINSVRECFKDGGYLQKYQDGDEKGGTFLVGYKNRLFKIESDFQVGESFDYLDAIGSGSTYALGSLYTSIKTKKEPMEIILTGLKTAEHFSTGVSSPFIIKNT